MFGHAHCVTSLPRLQTHQTSNLLKRFAQQHRLRISRDGCGDPIICGRNGDLADYGDHMRLIATFWGQGGFSRTRAQRIRRAITGNFGERKTGGPGSDEGMFTFDLADDRDVQFFLTALAIKPKRKTTPAMLAHLAQMRARARVKKSLSSRPISDARNDCLAWGDAMSREWGLQ